MKSPQAAIRSLLLPGWGQLRTGRSLLGQVLVVLSGLAAVAVITAYMFVGPLAILTWLIDPDVLLAALVMNALYLVARLTTGGMALDIREASKPGVLAVVTVGLLISFPHVAVGWVGWQARASIVSVFPTSEPLAAPVPTSTSTTISGTTTTTTWDLSPVVTTPGQTDEEVGLISSAPAWEPFGVDRLNILLLGGDAGPGRRGLRTDTMILVSLDPITGDAAMFGIPRNFGGVAFTDGTKPPVRRLNHVYGWGVDNAEAFPGADPGAGAVANAIENITGVQVDYFMLVDLTGFADVIDVFGGVRVNVHDSVDGPLYDEVTGGYTMVHISAGPQTLDGSHALAYARARYATSDYDRMARQRCILASVVAQSDFIELMGSLSDLLAVLESNVSTDLPHDKVGELVQLLPRVSAGQIRTIGLDPTWSDGFTADGHAIPDVERIRALVRTTLEDPGASHDLGVSTSGADCD